MLVDQTKNFTKIIDAQIGMNVEAVKQISLTVTVTVSAIVAAISAIFGAAVSDLLEAFRWQPKGNVLFKPSSENEGFKPFDRFKFWKPKK